MQKILRFFTVFCLFSMNLFSTEKPFIIGKLYGQLGNQMFQVATALSLAQDNAAIAIFPEFLESEEYNIPLNYKNVFHRIPTTHPNQHNVEFSYKEPAYHYNPIPYQPNMSLFGYFQSEKYFKKNKDLILETFAPSEEILSYLESKYDFILKHPKTVSLHLRFYLDTKREFHPFVGINYLRKALEKFDKDSLLVIFSDHIGLAKQRLAKILGQRKHVFIEGNRHFEDLYLMSLCKHNIISNSSFSWWGAYLNRNANKVVIAPKRWFGVYYKDYNMSDLIPAEWIIL